MPSFVDPAYCPRGWGRVVVHAGFQEVPGLHPGMGPTPGAVSESLTLRVGNSDPEAVAALMGLPGYREELPMLMPRGTLVLI